MAAIIKSLENLKITMFKVLFLITLLKFQKFFELKFISFEAMQEYAQTYFCKKNHEVYFLYCI